MPFGLAPNVADLLPSGRTNSIETRDQAPTSCSFAEVCWPTALPDNQANPNIIIADAPIRRVIVILVGPGSTGWRTCPRVAFVPLNHLVRERSGSRRSEWLALLHHIHRVQFDRLVGRAF